MPDLTKTSAIKDAFGRLMSTEVQEAYQTASICRELAREVQMNGNGEYVVVKVMDEAEDEALKDYVAYGDNPFGKVRTEAIKMVPDQQKWVGIDFDSVEFAMTNVNVREAKVRIEANRMALAFDKHVLGMVRADENIQKQQVALTKANIYEQINMAVRALDAVEVPVQDRVILMNYKTLSLLEQSPEMKGNFHVFTESRGLLGVPLSGCEVRVSNLINDGEVLVLQKDALNYVALIEKEAVGQHEANFAEFYKALFVFGAMIARPKSIVRIAPAE